MFGIANAEARRNLRKALVHPLTPVDASPDARWHTSLALAGAPPDARWRTRHDARWLALHAARWRTP